MKITKSELKEMIREALREELSKNASLQESVLEAARVSPMIEDSSETSDITITSCELEETINHMENMGRLPKLPYGWFIDDIDETSDDSRIRFSHRRLPLGICFYGKYYMGSTYDHCKYEFSYYISIDGTEFDHAAETFGPDPEGFISRIFEIVNNFNDIWENSTEKNFVKKLKAAGYKKA